MDNKLKSTSILGMPIQTARSRLVKAILFKLLKEKSENFCYRCSAEIESADELSIEHKEFWSISDKPLEAYMNLDNIAFSHHNCNAKYKSTNGVKHPSHRAYNEGCRCDGCREIEAERKRKQRAKK